MSRSVTTDYTDADSVLTCEHALPWDRRRLACTKREARKTSEAGETPAVPGKSIRKLRHHPDALELVLEQLHTSDCFYFPVRHHSPACAWHVARLIRELRPATILVEGPDSFTPLIPTILDPATKAPIAIYTHFIDTARKLYKPAENEPDFGPARFAAYYPSAITLPNSWL